MKKSWKDYFFDKERFDLVAATCSFLREEREKLHDAWIDALNNENWLNDLGDPIEVELKYPELCDEIRQLDRRIEAECQLMLELLK